MASSPATGGPFALGDDGRFAYSAQSSDGNVKILRRPLQSDGDPEVVAQLSAEALRTLLLWAEDEKSVTFSLTGPLAQQVKDLSGELSLTPEMFVWHAVKLFIEAAPDS